MSYNAWGCEVTGWSAIQIYKWAVLPDGRLLDELRRDEDRDQTKHPPEP